MTAVSYCKIETSKNKIWKLAAVSLYMLIPFYADTLASQLVMSNNTMTKKWGDASP